MTVLANCAQEKDALTLAITLNFKMLPEIYNNHLTTSLKKSSYLILLKELGSRNING